MVSLSNDICKLQYPVQVETLPIGTRWNMTVEEIVALCLGQLSWPLGNNF